MPPQPPQGRRERRVRSWCPLPSTTRRAREWICSTHRRFERQQITARRSPDVWVECYRPRTPGPASQIRRLASATGALWNGSVGNAAALRCDLRMSETRATPGSRGREPRRAPASLRGRGGRPRRRPRGTCAPPRRATAERLRPVVGQLDERSLADPCSAPEIVPVAIRSPVRTDAPFDVACASCCGIVQ